MIKLRGARQLSQVAAELGWRGHRVRLFAESVPRAVEASVDFRGPLSGPLPPADVAIASGSDTAGRVEQDSNSLFRLFLTGEPHLETESFERVLLDLCFARLDPMSGGAER